MLQVFKKHTKAAIAIILSLLIISAAVGTSLAYIIRRSASAKNTFVPVVVDSEAVSVSNGVGIRNNGETAAYVRATVVISWMMIDSEGVKHYHPNTPVEFVDYSISFSQEDTWIKRSDGFWYYKNALIPGTTTPRLIVDLQRIAEAPEGYQLSLEVISSALQSTPEEAVENAWGVTVSGGSILAD
jgi:hypothetical protein